MLSSQKSRLQYIKILSQSKYIYILNFVFTFYVFSLIAILFICMRFLPLFSIVFGIINWMIQREQKTAKHFKIRKIEYLLIKSAFLSQVKESGIRKN